MVCPLRRLWHTCRFGANIPEQSGRGLRERRGRHSARGDRPFVLPPGEPLCVGWPRRTTVPRWQPGLADRVTVR
jgi:hypothetical protein